MEYTTYAVELIWTDFKFEVNLNRLFEKGDSQIEFLHGFSPCYAHHFGLIIRFWCPKTLEAVRRFFIEAVFDNYEDWVLPHFRGHFHPQGAPIKMYKMLGHPPHGIITEMPIKVSWPDRQDFVNKMLIF